jgi:hypothetical protein
MRKITGLGLLARAEVLDGEEAGAGARQAEIMMMTSAIQGTRKS